MKYWVEYVSDMVFVKYSSNFMYVMVTAHMNKYSDSCTCKGSESLVISSNDLFLPPTLLFKVHSTLSRNTWTPCLGLPIWSFRYAVMPWLFKIKQIPNTYWKLNFYHLSIKIAKRFFFKNKKDDIFVFCFVVVTSQRR